MRALTGDEPAQAAAAQRLLGATETVALPSPMLCELVRVLRRGYRVPEAEIVATLRRLADSAACVTDRRAGAAGIAMLESGGDFADGLIAHDGRSPGGAVFASFDANAVALLRAAGHDAVTPE